MFPVFITFYIDDAGSPQMIYVNEQTGKISGPRLASQKKGWKVAGIFTVVAVVLFILAFICFGLATLLSPLSELAVLLIVFAFGAGILAIIPAVWPWQWNRQLQEHKITSA